MNTTTETRVPSPEMEVAQEAPAANLPEAIAGLKIAEPLRDRTTGEPIRAHGHTATKEFGEVVGAIAAVMMDLHPVEKGGKNTFHNYKYARMQDILQMLTPLMGKHGLVVFQYEDARNMFDESKVIAITYRFVVAHKSGQTWIDPVPQTGMSPCRTSKGTFDDKAFAKCHTSARKYFLLSLFQVPTEDENDPDNEKRERANAPVPSPDGHIAPHLIEPVSRDTFDSWADRYLAAARTSKTLAEVDQWDQVNDSPLAQMDASDNGKPVYDRILKEFEVIRSRLSWHSQMHNPTSEKAVTATTAAANTVPPATKFVRPAGCPDAEKDPDGFVEWAMKRMDSLDNQDDLSNVWETEINEAMDGLFKPDVDSLKQYYEKRMAKVGG
jgi:ERF superfamily protein